MKTFIYTILTLTLFLFNPTNVLAQDEDYTPFIGTWEWQNGNEVFRVNLFEETDLGLVGHYEMVQQNNGFETVVFTSKRFVDGNEVWPPYVISGRTGISAFAGTIRDNTVNAQLYDSEKRGKLVIVILTDSGGLNPTITASWKVERKSYQSGLTDDEAPDFSVPTDIILTKVN
jgi:hypothetical protein